MIDSDGDGVCDLEEVFGCTDPDAINYDPLATEDDGTCEFQVGLDEIGDPIQLIAFMENPTSEVLGIRISSIEHRTVLMTVHAMDGRLVQSAQVQILAGDNVIYQDVAYLKQGVYLLRFSWVNSNVTQSFIKL
ncbi:MAG: T9SS type A sorting domain-containing protein [Bacteroidetes bacterium]|nr:T9SS type A sorting domain-containing protein [Bacteroidota bacterium]